MSDDYSSNKLVVFTAFKREKFSSQEEWTEENSFRDVWYPTIFFYDLHLQRVDWEFFGAELFINIDGHQKVTVLSNEIYTEIGAKEFQELQEEEDFSRHNEFDSYFQKIKYNTCPRILEPENESAPFMPTLRSYKLSFGINKKLDITEGSKIVEAYMHFDAAENTDRITLIYKGLGSYTFTLK